MAENKSRKKKRRDTFHYMKIVIVALLAVLIGVFIFLSYRAGTLIFTDDGATKEGEKPITYTIDIKKGMGTMRIGQELKHAGVIRSTVVFMVQSKLYRCKIAPGSYTLSSADSSKAILKYLNEEYQKRVSGS